MRTLHIYIHRESSYYIEQLLYTYISYKNSEESKQDCSNIYAIKKGNYQKRVKDFISTTFLIP